VDNQNQKTQNSKPAICKHCQSHNTRKYGFVEGVQKYFCNECRRKFGSDDYLFRMKTPYLRVSSALEDYYTGKSINDIRDSFNTQYLTPPPSSKTVYGWITKFTDEAINQFQDYHPQVGNTWIVDKTILKLSGKNYWCIDIIDRDTHYFLATKLSAKRNKNDIKVIMKRGRDRAGKRPERILTDGWNGYRYGIDLAFGSDSKQIVIDRIDEAEFIERWPDTLKSRNKTLRNLKSLKTANKFLCGFLVWYNYLKPDESLNGKTPAEEAKVKYTSKSWVDVIRAVKPQIQVLTNPAKEVITGRH
jgi:putative transposase